MKRISLLAIMACGFLYAGPLSFESGLIKAHTEVFGDSTIDPVTKKIVTNFTMDADPLTLKGSVSASMLDLMSDNKKRDEHMHESIDSMQFHDSVFDLKEVIAKGGNNYVLKGTMSLHGVTKPMSFESTISQEGNKVRIKAQGSLRMTDYAIKPIKMVFLTVRDQVDLSVDVLLKR